MAFFSFVMQEERERHRLREKQRELREEERRRRDEAARQREIERKQRDEAIRLERLVSLGSETPCTQCISTPPRWSSVAKGWAVAGNGRSCGARERPSSENAQNLFGWSEIGSAWRGRG